MMADMRGSPLCLVESSHVTSHGNEIITMTKPAPSNQRFSIICSRLQNDWARYAWECWIALSICLIMSCTSESGPSSTSTPAQQGVTGAIPTGPANTPVAVETGGLLSTPNKASSGSPESGIEALYADTDGDQFSEQIGICERSKLCILHQSASSPNTYTQAGWADVYLAGVENTDGERGEEVIVIARNPDGKLACLCVIHERTGSVQSYVDPSWYTISIAAITDTDGEPGTRHCVHCP